MRSLSEASAEHHSVLFACAVVHFERMQVHQVLNEIIVGATAEHHAALFACAYVHFERMQVHQVLNEIVVGGLALDISPEEVHNIMQDIGRYTDRALAARSTARSLYCTVHVLAVNVLLPQLAGT